MYDILKLLLDPISLIIAIIFALIIILYREKGLKSRRIILNSLIGIMLLIYLLSISPVTNLLFYPLERDYLTSDIYDVKPPEIVVVLVGGCYLNDTKEKLFIAHETPSRLIHGIQIFKKYNAKLLVCSGGGKIVEGQVMADVAERLGIDKAKILVEGKSLNTIQHAKELSLLINDKNQIIGIVTYAYHMKRSIREFRKFFKNVVPIPSEFIYSRHNFHHIEHYIPTSYNLYKSSVAIKEIFGNLWYIIR